MRSRVLDPCSIIRVQTWDSHAAAPPNVERVLGVAWPLKTGIVASGRSDIICTGPTDWLVVATDPDARGLLHRIEEAFAASTFRATNVSHALIRIEIDGAEARALLAKGCSLDLHPARFATGSCARTLFAGMPVILRCTQPTTFEGIVTRSYAEYLLDWLADASAEFAGSAA
jgi:sarcosine oxidase, subunit gamma